MKLVWQTFQNSAHYADANGRRYVCRRPMGRPSAWLLKFDRRPLGYHATLDAAKAAAQEHHDATR